MQLLLIVIFFVGFAYFTGKLRRIDAFTVAYFSASLYFLPGLVGYTLSPVTPVSPIKLPMPVESEATAIMATVLGAIVFGGILWDEYEARRPAAKLVWRLEDARLAAEVALLMALCGVVLAWAETGGAVFATDKRIVIASVGRGHLAWEIGAILAAAFAITHGKKGVLVGAFALLLLDMYIGFRFAFACAFIACFWLQMDAGKATRLSDLSARTVALVILGGLAIISYQNLKEPVREGNWSEVGSRLSDPLWYFQGIMTSEPFTTQTVLNEVVRKDFRTGTDHLTSASHHLIVFAPSLGAEAARFNDQYQPALFPAVDHGLANNIWAQFWSAGGWPLLLAFTSVYVALLAGGSRAMQTTDPALRALWAVFFAFWCFYIHRNELLTQLGFQKQTLLAWAACTIAAVMLGSAMRRTHFRKSDHNAR
jgi:hypothetical protein